MPDREGMYVRLLYILNSPKCKALPITLFPETLWMNSELEELLGIEKQEEEEDVDVVAEKEDVNELAEKMDEIHTEI